MRTHVFVLALCLAAALLSAIGADGRAERAPDLLEALFEVGELFVEAEPAEFEV